MTAADSEQLEVFVGVKNGLDGCETTVSSVSMILPIALDNFLPVVQLDKVKLTWETFGNSDVGKIAVERSQTGNEWEEITVIDLEYHKRQTVFKAYDQAPYPGHNYYRLRLVHDDGNIQYSEVIRAEVVLKDTQSFRLYPNPAVDHVNFLNHSSTTAVDVQVKLYDHRGMLVSEETLAPVSPMSSVRLAAPSHINRGVYFYHIYHDSELTRLKVIFR